MSSTNRGTKRPVYDYYITPISEIVLFLKTFGKYEGNVFPNILDPCAGGDRFHQMSYPVAIEKAGITFNELVTIDIREDSLAMIKGDYLTIDNLDNRFDLIISNPPFDLSMGFIKKSLRIVKDNGFVIMLLRLNFFGSISRKPFWDNNMCKYCFVHHKRMSFTEDGRKDSIEYAHFVWQKGYKGDYTKLFVI